VLGTFAALSISSGVSKTTVRVAAVERQVR
jgi:hypothetical protein